MIGKGRTLRSTPKGADLLQQSAANYLKFDNLAYISPQKFNHLEDKR